MPDTRPTDDPALPSPTTRRHVLQGAAAVTLVGGAGALLTACGSSSASSAAGSTSTATSTGASTDSSSASTSPSTQSSSAPSGTTLGPTSDVEVGGGKIYTAEKVVVTQPSAGEFKCFSAVCTHQGCLVGSISDGEIVCPCHNSHFSIADGSVVSGPAPSALPSETLTVSGTDLILDA